LDAKRKPDQNRFPSSRTVKPVVWGKARHRISRRDIDPDAIKIGHRLNKFGFIAYLTGAAVQNLMQRIPPKDFDIVTDARPGQIKKRFANTYLIGRRFRLAHVHFKDGKIIEVATFRRAPDANREEKGDIGARRRDSYGTPRQDAFRRDISISALYYDLATEAIIDYVGGLNDLTNKIIRVIGDPGERFTEDPVRIIRAVRHSARLGFRIEQSSERAVGSHRHLLAECPGARLFEELKKDLSLKTRPVFESFRRYDLLRTYLGLAGKTYESDTPLFSRLTALLDVMENARSSGASFSPLELYALVHWPWVELHLPGKNGDMHNAIDNLLRKNSPAAVIPKKFLADSIELLTMVGYLSQSLRTGRWKQSWKRRAHYTPASRISYLIEKKRLPQQGESFEGLHRRIFRSRHRRRRPPRRNPARLNRAPVNTNPDSGSRYSD